MSIAINLWSPAMTMNIECGKGHTLATLFSLQGLIFKEDSHSNCVTDDSKTGDFMNRLTSDF